MHFLHARGARVIDAPSSTSRIPSLRACRYEWMSMLNRRARFCNPDALAIVQSLDSKPGTAIELAASPAAQQEGNYKEPSISDWQPAYSPHAESSAGKPSPVQRLVLLLRLRRRA